MPTPRSGETRGEYMGHCVREVMNEGLSQDQAVGKCEGMYSSHANKEMTAVLSGTGEEEKPMVNNPTGGGGVGPLYLSLRGALTGREMQGGEVALPDQGQGDPVVEKSLNFYIPSHDPVGGQVGGLTFGEQVEKDLAAMAAAPLPVEEDLTAAGGGAPLVPQHLGHEVVTRKPPAESIIAAGGQGGREALIEPSNRLAALKALVDAFTVRKATSDYEPPPSGGHSEHEKKILAAAYASARDEGYSKERAAKIAWGAVNNATGKDHQVDLITRLRIAQELQDIVDQDPFQEIETGQPEEAEDREPGDMLSEIQEAVEKALTKSLPMLTVAHERAAEVEDDGRSGEYDPDELAHGDLRVRKALRDTAADMAVAMKGDLKILRRMLNK